ncbi:MAG: hypothetical protein LAO21_18045 [Acidobacteriia bacterium]|nr:hypothetical protein [Terriglobia bacterium]
MKWKCFLGLGLLLVVCPAFPQSSGSNGVYGGYVGSARWFEVMRQSAANSAMLRSLGRTESRPVVPPDFVEVAGVFAFIHGNPFPKGRIPNLRIRCANPSADNVERSPFISQTEGEAPAFYTVFKKGETYNFSWMYYFGSKEQFASFSIPADAAKQMQVTISVDPKGKGRILLAR